MTIKRVVFMGTPGSVLGPLEVLLGFLHQGRIEFLGVVSQPAKPSGRKQELLEPEVVVFARKHDLPLMQPLKASEPVFLENLRAWAPDLIITASYGQILTTTFLAIPKRGVINIHPSRLPAYRGATPVQEALRRGDQETAVSILFTVKALDAGNIIAQKTFAIHPDETSAGLLDRLFGEGGKMLSEVFALLENPSFQGTPQDESQVSFSKKIQKEDGRLCFTGMSANEIICKARAYDPWPGIYTTYQGKRVIFTKLMHLPFLENPPKPGDFLFLKNEKALLVGTADSGILVQKLKPEGKAEIDAASFWNGIKDRTACFFEEEL